MIPPTIHFVWVGGKTMPCEYAQNIVGWTRLHPRWNIRVWDDDNRPVLRNEYEFKMARNPAQASDVLRYELMLRYGGIYLDCDVEPVQSLRPLRRYEAFAVDQGEDILCTAVLGSEPGHPAFEAVVAALPAAFASGLTNLDQAGPTFQTPILRAHGVTVLPQETFYPYLWDEEPRPATPETFGIHRWAKSWVPAEWNT